MIDSLYLAWRYLAFNRARTAILVGCVTLIAVTPLTLDLLLAESELQLLSRAETTPLVVGAKGSALDLVMSTLYFSDEVPESITMSATDEVMATDLAVAIPMYVRFRARGFPIVGTTLDYIDFRALEIALGRSFGMLGECVIGAAVARELGLTLGDHLVSSPETLFDLAGVYPLKMRIVGVLAPTHSADDLAVLVDVKTAWVIEGLAHGHQDLAQNADPSVILERSAEKVTANAKLVQYTEITRDNLGSFHFHGDPSSFPITAVIAQPLDDKSGTILRGRYLGNEVQYQVVRPRDVIDTLLENIFRIKRVLDAVIALVALATLLALILVFALSLRLRRREVQTIFKLGCSRATTARLLGAEILLILVIAGALCAALLALVGHFDQPLVRSLFV